MKKILASVLCTLFLVSLCACGSQKTAQSHVVLSEVTHSVFYAPQYAALYNGYFTEEGIDLELVNGQGADAVMTAVLSGSADIGLAGPEASIYVYNEGRDDYCRVFAQLTQRDGSFLMARTAPAGKAFIWEDLRGSTLLPGRKGGVPYMTLEHVVRSHGLEPGKDLTFDDSVQFAAMASAFAAGTGDYVTLFEPTASALEKQGVGTIVASIGEESGEIPYTAYFAPKSYLSANADLITRFTRAIYKGQQFVASHTAAQIAQAIAPAFPDTDEALLESAIARYQSIDAWRDAPTMKEEAFDRLQSVMTEAGELKKAAPFQDLIDNSFAEQVIAEAK